ncbi:MAG: hypothetical protein ABI763_06110, partial [Bacteroidota bacterium]
FVRASSGDDGLETIMKEIGKMDKKSFGSKQFSNYEDRFQYFIGAALLILILEFIISNRKSKWMEKVNVLISGK